MSQFENLRLTTKGHELLAKAMTGQVLEFTKIVMGDGTIVNEGKDITDVISAKQEIRINSYEQIDSNITLVGVLKLSDIKEGFTWTELGLYAKGSDGIEHLYLYDNAKDKTSYVSNIGLNEKIIRLTVAVGSATNVKVNIDTMLSVMTMKEFEETGATKDDLKLKRDKQTKITRYDLDTSKEDSKIKLVNLGDEVIEAMAGTSPVIPTVADRSIAREKIAPRAVSMHEIDPVTFEPFRYPYFENLPLPIGKVKEDGHYLVSTLSQHDIVSSNGNCFHLLTDTRSTEVFEDANGRVEVTITEGYKVRIKGNYSTNLYIKLTNGVDIGTATKAAWHPETSPIQFECQCGTLCYDIIKHLPGCRLPGFLIRNIDKNSPETNVMTLTLNNTPAIGTHNKSVGYAYLYYSHNEGDGPYEFDCEFSVGMWIKGGLTSLEQCKVPPKFEIARNIGQEVYQVVKCWENGSISLLNNEDGSEGYAFRQDISLLEDLKYKRLDLYNYPYDHAIYRGGTVTYDVNTRTFKWTSLMLLIDPLRPEKRIKIGPGEITLPSEDYWTIYIDLNLARTLPENVQFQKDWCIDAKEVVKYGTYITSVNEGHEYVGNPNQKPLFTVGGGTYNNCTNLDVEIIGYENSTHRRISAINQSVNKNKSDQEKQALNYVFMPMGNPFTCTYDPKTKTLTWNQDLYLPDQLSAGGRFKIRAGSFTFETDTTSYGSLYVDLGYIRASQDSGGSNPLDPNIVFKFGRTPVENDSTYKARYDQLPLLIWGTSSIPYVTGVLDIDVIGNEKINLPGVNQIVNGVKGELQTEIEKVHNTALANKFPYVESYEMPFVSPYDSKDSACIITGNGSGILASTTPNMVPLSDSTHTAKGLTVTVEGNAVRLKGELIDNKGTYVRLSGGAEVDGAISSLPPDLHFDGEYTLRLYAYKQGETHNTPVGSLFFRGIGTEDSPTNQLQCAIHTGGNTVSGRLKDTKCLYLYTTYSGIVDCEFKLEMTRKGQPFSLDKIPYTFSKPVNISGEGTFNIPCFKDGEVVIKSAGTLLGVVEIKDTGLRKDIELLTQEVETVAQKILYDENKLVIDQRPDRFRIFIKGTCIDSAKYLSYYLTHNIISSSNYDGWKIYGAHVAERTSKTEFNILHQFVNGGEWECALKIKGAEDFMGGTAHGDELHTLFRVEIDGIEQPLDFTGVYECNQLKAIQKSKLYSPITGEYVADHLKVYHFRPKGEIELYQEVIWKSVQLMDLSYLTMLPISRTHDNTVTGIPITSRVYDDMTYDVYDVSLEGHNEYPKQMKHGVTKYNLWSVDNESHVSPGISAEVEVLKQEPLLPNCISFIQNTSAYNKVYFDFCGQNYSTSENEKWIMHTMYRLNINK